MERVDYGAGVARFEIDGNGIVDASFGGLVVPANAGALSALLLRIGADRAAQGVLCSVQTALIALPPIDPRHYGYVPPSLRGVPVAVVVTPEQLCVYDDIARAAATTGAIRRAFLSREQAQDWLREQARALQANQIWPPAHRSPR